MPLLSPVPEKNASSARTETVVSSFSPEANNSFSGLGQVLSFEDGHIRVACRVRPPNARETAFKITNDEAYRAAQAKSMTGDEAIEVVSASGRCLTVLDDHTTVVMNAKPTPKIFSFDYAIHETATQEEIFATIGKPISNACLEGYNSTMLAYGQTGSGKSFTMFGPESGLSTASNDRNLWGIVPRSIDFLFSQIAREIRRSNGDIKFSCKSSFFEIFNERVFDLLDAANTDTHNANSSGKGDRQINDRSSRGSRSSYSVSLEDTSSLQVREDQTRGVYVDGLNETAVNNTGDAIRVLEKGYRNRRVAETAMNHESSRSHAVFQLQLKSEDQSNPTGKRKTSLFTLVDLAGSERQSGTSAAGDRLKEANAINKSLSSLGQVINALVDRGQGKTRHVPYRDSKLTFLLRDSLGGNSRTFLIATVSPCEEQFGESLSTLKFSQRAKMITNSAVVNEDVVGNAETLRLEVSRLKQELAKAKLKITQTSRNVTSNDEAPSEFAIAPAEVDEVLMMVLQRHTALFNQCERYLQRLKSFRMLNEKNTNQLQAASFTIKMLRSSIATKEPQVTSEEEAKIISLLEKDMLKLNEAHKWMAACDEMHREIVALRGEEDPTPAFNNLSGFVKEGPGCEFLKDLQVRRSARDKVLGLSNGKDAASRSWTEENETTFQFKLQDKLVKEREEKEALMLQLQAIMEQKNQVSAASILSPNISGDEDCKSIIATQFGGGSDKDSFNLLDDIVPNASSSRRVSTATSRRSSVGRLGRLSIGGDVSQWSSNLESNKKIREAELKAESLSKQLHEKSLELAEANKINSVLQREKAEIVAGTKAVCSGEVVVSPSDDKHQMMSTLLQSSQDEVAALKEEIERLEKCRFEDEEAAEAAEAQLRALAKAEMEEGARQKELALQSKQTAEAEAALSEAASIEAAALRKVAEEAKEAEEVAQAKIKDLEDEIETLTEQVEYTKACSLEKSKENETLKNDAVESAREVETSKRQLESQKESFLAMKEQLLASSRADTEGSMASLNLQLTTHAEKLATSIEVQEALKFELASLTATLNKSEEIVSELRQQLHDAQASSESTSAVAEELRNEVWLLREDVSTLEASKANLEAELASVSEDREEVVASLEEAERVAEEARELLEIEKAQYLEELQKQSEDIAGLEEALESEQQMIMDLTSQYQKQKEETEAAWNSKIDLIQAQESAALARAEQAEAEVGVLRKDTQRDVQESERELLATQHALKREQEAHQNLKNQAALQSAQLEEQRNTATELSLQVKQLEGERESLFERMIHNDVAIEASQREAKNLQDKLTHKDKLNDELSERLVAAEAFAQEIALESAAATEKAASALANADQSKLMEQEGYDKVLKLETEVRDLKKQIKDAAQTICDQELELLAHTGQMSGKQKIHYTEGLRVEVSELREKNMELTKLYNKSQTRLKDMENGQLPLTSTRSKTPMKRMTPSSTEILCESLPLKEKDTNTTEPSA